MMKTPFDSRETKRINEKLMPGDSKTKATPIHHLERREHPTTEARSICDFKTNTF